MNFVLSSTFYEATNESALPPLQKISQKQLKAMPK